MLVIEIKAEAAVRQRKHASAQQNLFRHKLWRQLLAYVEIERRFPEKLWAEPVHIRLIEDNNNQPDVTYQVWIMTLTRLTIMVDVLSPL